SFWTTYEISLFGNSLSLFSENLLVILLKEIKKRIQEYQIMHKDLRDLIRLLQNGALILLRKNKVNRALELSNFLITAIERDQYFEKTRQLFIDGVITFALGKKDEGIKGALQAIKIIENFDEQLAKNHRLELEGFQQLYKE
ncbi:MAG: hypothetical protein L0J49_05770, partial [Lactococcus lactis]|nr:hypothetical protein [Lactococcus lactis]